jgi:hypothetical protein
VCREVINAYGGFMRVVWAIGLALAAIIIITVFFKAEIFI